MGENDFIDTEILNQGQFLSFKNNSFFEDQIFYFRTFPRITEKILKTYKNQKDTLTDTRKNLAGDIKEEYKIDDRKEFVKLFKSTLTERINHIFNGGVKEVGIGPVWINEMKSGEYNPTHQHIGYFSFIWYLDIPEKIRKEHMKQKGNTPSKGLIEFQSLIGGGDLKLNPKTNDLLIFNSRQPHIVWPFETKNVSRISLAGNVMSIEFKDGRKIEPSPSWEERK